MFINRRQFNNYKKERIKFFSKAYHSSFLSRIKINHFLEYSDFYNETEKLVDLFIRNYFEMFSIKSANNIELEATLEYSKWISFYFEESLIKESDSTIQTYFMLLKKYNAESSELIKYVNELLNINCVMFKYGLNVERIQKLLSSDNSINMNNLYRVYNSFKLDESFSLTNDFIDLFNKDFNDADWIHFMRMISSINDYNYWFSLSAALLSQYKFFYKYDRLPYVISIDESKLKFDKPNKDTLLNEDNYKKSLHMIEELFSNYLSADKDYLSIEKDKDIKCLTPYYKEQFAIVVCKFLRLNNHSDKDLKQMWDTSNEKGRIYEKIKTLRLDKKMDQDNRREELKETREHPANITSLKSEDINVPDWQCDPPSSISVETTAGTLDYNPNTGHATDSDGNDYLYDSANDVFKS